MTAATALGACASDGPTAPTSPPVSAPPLQNPDTPTPNPTMGAVTVEIGEVPPNSHPTIIVRSASVQREIGQTGTLDSLPPGDYQVFAPALTVDDVRWEAQPDTQVVSVRAAQAAPRIFIRFAPVAASIIVRETGLPSYARSTVRITGANGFVRTALTRDTVRLLGAGKYTVVAEDVETTDGRFQAAPTTATVTLSASSMGIVDFAFAPVRAGLTVDVDGLPNGVPAGIQVSGPGAFSTRVDATRTLSGLEPGLYSARAARVSASGFSYDPNAALLDASVSGTQQRTISFSYQLASGAVAAIMGGLPSGVSAAATLTGPDGFSRAVTGTQTITDLAPGSYRLTSRNVVHNGVTYSPSPATLNLVVTASMVAVPASVRYSGTVGAIDFTVDGLPPSMSPNVTFTGPGNAVYPASASGLLANLPPGAYVMEAGSVTGPSDSWDPDVTSRQVQVGANDTISAAVHYTPRTGSLSVSVVGLPTDVAGSVRITGPGGTDRSITASTVLSSLPVGTYTITASTVSKGATSYTPSPASSTIVVARGATATRTISYGGTSTALTLDFSGLPGGMAPSATVSGPNGYAKDVTGATVLENLAPGTYRVTAVAVSSSSATYAPSPTTRDITLQAGERTLSVFDYALSTGSIAISVAGLPSGESATVSVSGPGGFSQAVTGTQTLVKLTPGQYTIVAADVTINGTTYSASPKSRTVTVTAKLVAAAAPLSYGTSVGAMRVVLSGLPAAVNGAVTLEGPGNVSHTLAQTTVLDALAVGSWTVVGHEVTVSGDRYLATPASRTITVLSADTVEAPLTFARTTGRLTLTVSGLPDGSSADVTVTGPAGYSRTVNASQTLVGLETGTYTIAANDVAVGATNYAPSSSSQSLVVTGGSSASRTISYSGTTTALSVVLSGIPNGALAAVNVSGPGGYGEVVSTSTSLTALNAGTYTIFAPRLLAGSYGYTGTPASQTVALGTGETKSANIVYQVASGALKVTITGLPSSLNAPVTVAGPNGYSRTVTKTTTLTDVPAGVYTVSAASTSSGSTSFTPTSATQTATVSVGATASRTVSYNSSSTALSIEVNGLPGSTNSAVTVTGPGGYSQPVTSTTTLTDLAAGSYTIAAANVVSSGNTYTPAAASQTVSLTAGQQLSRTVTYAASTSSLTITVSGVPSGASAPITVTGPASYSRGLSTTETLSGLAPGAYTVTTDEIVRNGYRYTSAPTSEVVQLTAGATTRYDVDYAVTAGRMYVTVNGLPDGILAPVTVSGPGGFSASVTSSAPLNGLEPGTYTVTANTVSSGSTLYSPSSASQTATVTAGSATYPTVTYSGATTSLAVTISGLPGATNAAVVVSGPGGFSQTLTASQTLTNLSPGTYTVAANSISNGGYNYTGSPATQARTVTTGQQQTAAVTYAVTTGRLTVSVSGLPGSTNAGVTVTGPSGYSQAVTSTTTLQNLVPGTYTVSASNVTSGATLYAPSPTSQTAAVTAGSTLSRSVAYSGSGTSLAITISGVPSGATAALSVTGPSSYSKSVTSSTTLSDLTAGTYAIAAAAITNGGYTYSATPASQSKSVATGQQQTATVAYAVSTGRLTVSVSGLPGGVNASVSVSGPSGFAQNVTSSTTLESLTAGTYTIAASDVSSGGSTYAPATASQTVAVTAGATASKSVAYAVTGGGGGGGGGGGSDPDLSVESAYITQAIQSYDGSVPLVAGREAMLRVFVKAASANTLRPTVRVRLYTGSSPFRTFTISAPSNSVPTSITEGTLASSWNAALSASDMRTGLKILVDVDPTDAVNEPDESDNVWPRSGSTAIDVRTVSPFNVVFVPVHQSVNDRVGNVSTANMESQYLSMTRQVMPLESVNASVRSTYTTNAAALQSTDGNMAWLTILSEMNSLRVADGSSANYMGVVNVSYGGGVAGYAYVPGKAGVVWDKSSTAPRVTAHELGHNFSRRHVAACGSGNTDTNYPYASGQISMWGWNSTSNALVSTSTTDIMGYCGTQWISDYTWTNVLNYRSSSSMEASYVGGDQRTLMVWGRIRNGVVTLEPALRMVTRPVVAERSGAYRLELRDKNGGVLTGFTFDPEVIDHDNDAQAFAFAVPMSLTTESRLVSVAVVGGTSGTVEQTARVSMASLQGNTAGAPATRTADDGSTVVSDPQATITRSGNSNRVEWDDQTYPLALVRDAQSGQVLAYLRRAGDSFIPRGGQVRISFSNGVQSITQEMSTR